MGQLVKLLPRSKRSALTRGEIMARIRSRDTEPEMRIRCELLGLGVRYRMHVTSLPGKPDFANKSRRWALFVHGCFWHSHQDCRFAAMPKSNLKYWLPKLRRNKERDHENELALKKLGYRVQVIWECEAYADVPLKRTLRNFLF